MAIDFYEGRAHRFSLPEKAFIALEDALLELRTRAGRNLDPYSTSQLEPAHARLWREGLQRVSGTLRPDASNEQFCRELLLLLDDVIRRGVTLTIEGE